MDYLNRDQSPFGDDVWRLLDDAAVGAAREVLTGRRFLTVEGPYGPGLTTIEVGNDESLAEIEADQAAVVLGQAIAVPMLRRGFRLSVRRMAAFVENGQPLDLAPVQAAAEAVAVREEEMLYQGQPDFDIAGLLTAPGRALHSGGNWSEVDRALEDVLAAVTRLDDAGFRGPYALVLEPALYNGLFRRYPGTELLQLEHLRRLCTKGIYKAAIQGGALIDPRVGSLIVGHDLASGYVGQNGIHYEFHLVESVVFRLEESRAICVISATPGARGY